MSGEGGVPWRTLVLLLGANALLGAFLAGELRREHDALAMPVPPPETAPPPFAVPETAPADPRPLAPIEAYSAIVERPLFLPGRQPPALVRPASPAPGELPALKGVIVTAERAIALFQLPDSAHYMLGEAGAAVGAWRVETIAPGRVELSRGSVRRTLELEDRAPVRPLPAGGAAADPEEPDVEEDAANVDPED